MYLMSRYNFGKLTQSIEPVMQKIIASHPSLKLALVNVADLREVPSNFIKMVSPILNTVDKKNRGKGLAQYSETPEAHASHNGSHLFFIPDYEGATLSLLGFEDANW